MNKLTVLRAPISVNLEVTKVCNLQCEFCCSNSATFSHKNPTLEQVKRVIDALAKAEVFEIRLFGGEFIALSGWKEIVAYAHDKNFFMAFVSNGTLLTSDSAKYLARYGITGGAISIHGPEQIHDKIVGVPGAFSMAVEAINNCWEEGISITTLFTPTQMNFSHLYELAQWFKANSIPVSEISVGRLCPSGEAERDWGKRRLSLEDYKHLFLIMQRIYEDFGTYVFMGDAFPLCVIPYEDWKMITGCWQGTGFGQVSYTGEVKSCSILGGSYGNILKEDLCDIWIKKLRIMRTLSHLPIRCRCCPNFCGGGCSASRFGASHFAADEFIPAPGKESIFTFGRWVYDISKANFKKFFNRLEEKKDTKEKQDKLLPFTAKPKLGFNYRIRKDLDGYIGFFKGYAVLTLDEAAVNIIKLIDGRRSVEDIVHEVQKLQPTGSEKVMKNTISFLTSAYKGSLVTFS